jgi:hypothetical protein
MTASSPLDAHLAQSACSAAYVVQEPSEHDADSQLSPSVDTETPMTRYTMAEMEAYIQLVRKDRYDSCVLYRLLRKAALRLLPSVRIS